MIDLVVFLDGKATTGENSAATVLPKILPLTLDAGVASVNVPLPGSGRGSDLMHHGFPFRLRQIGHGADV